VNQTLSALKPSSSARTQLFLAALVWTCVGTGLSAAGANWCVGAVATPWNIVLIAGGLTLGFLKGEFVIAKTARKSASRIIGRGDGMCLGGVFSWKTWLLVFVMMGSGAALRRSAMPRSVLGVLYVGIGAALIWASRIYWRAWKETN